MLNKRALRRQQAEKKSKKRWNRWHAETKKLYPTVKLPPIGAYRESVGCMCSMCKTNHFVKKEEARRERQNVKKIVKNVDNDNEL